MVTMLASRVFNMAESLEIVDCRSWIVDCRSEMVDEGVTSSGMGISDAVGMLPVRVSSRALMRSVMVVSSESESPAEIVDDRSSIVDFRRSRSGLEMLPAYKVPEMVAFSALMSCSLATRAEIVAAVSSPSTMMRGSLEAVIDRRS